MIFLGIGTLALGLLFSIGICHVEKYFYKGTVIAYGLGAFILFKTGGNFIKGTKNNYTKPELECYKLGDTLVIKQVNKTHMSFGFFSSDIKLDVYVPSNYNKDIKLVSFSGDININGYKLNKLQCNLSSGDINITLALAPVL